jgi:phospholipase/carboxylesterase
MTRRQLLGMGAAALTTLACGPTGASGGDGSMQEGRLTQRPRPPRTRLAAGRHPLDLGGERDGLLVVPQTASAEPPLPLIVMLHGAGGRARNAESAFRRAAALGIVVLAPDSRGTTWDAIRGEFGPDVAFLDRALGHTFDRCHIDPARTAIGGFSDGASYALSIGLRNGDLFTHIVAFSPGFVVPGEFHGKPPVFLSHGVHDRVLPIDRTSRVIVPRLRRDGYEVDYAEFDGPHTVPADLEERALRWLASTPRPTGAP